MVQKKRTENDSRLNSLYLLESTKKQRRIFWAIPKSCKMPKRNKKPKQKSFYGMKTVYKTQWYRADKRIELRYSIENDKKGNFEHLRYIRS